jgi:hypothetical protein
MRADMHKVFSSSRHRRGQLWNKVKQKGTSRARAHMFDEDNHAYVEPISKRSGFRSRRQKSDVLRRFIRSQVGRPWSQVHSEICARLDMRNEVQRNVRERINWFVEQDVVLVDGVPHDSLARYRVQSVWVHPDTGILMAPPKKKPYELSAEQVAYVERQKRLDKPRYKIDANHRLVYLEDYGENGRWYVVTLKPLPETEPENYSDYPQDAFSHVWSSDWAWTRAQNLRTWGEYVYAAEKRPASNKLVRRILNAAEREDSDNRVVKRSPRS